MRESGLKSEGSQTIKSRHLQHLAIFWIKQYRRKKEEGEDCGLEREWGGKGRRKEF